MQHFFLPSACFSPIRTDREKHLSDSGSPQIPLESEGTAVLPIPLESERKARFYSLCPAGAEEKNTRIGKEGRPLRFFWNLRGPGKKKVSIDRII